MRTTACAACCGLAGVGAFLSAPSTSIVSSRNNNPHTSSSWGNSALSSPLSLVGGGSANARASVCPSPDGDGEGESRRDAAVKGGVRRHGGGRGGGSGRRHRAATLGNLDLKPAYRLFDTVPPPPSTDATARKSDDIDLDVDGDAPYGKKKRRHRPRWTQRAAPILSTCTILISSGGVYHGVTRLFDVLGR